MIHIRTIPADVFPNPQYQRKTTMTEQPYTNSQKLGMRAAPSKAARDAYTETFYRRIRALLRATNTSGEADDIASAEVVSLLEKLPTVMASYADPYVYASVRASAGRAAVDYLRKQSVQAGRGARNERRVVNGDGIYHDIFADHYDGQPGVNGRQGTYFSVFSAELPDFEGSIVDRFESDRLMRQALMSVPRDQRAVLMLVDYMGYTVTTAASILGLRRETVARKRTKAITAVRIAIERNPFNDQS